MSISLGVPKLVELRPRIKVIGVGGAGGNAINNMITSGLTGVDFIAANTDAQSLVNSCAEQRLQLGAALTDGLGAGSRPEIGQAAAEESIEDIRTHLKNAHMVFIAAGMGGGTGTGAASVIARVAKDEGLLTVAVVTKPFHFEGTRRMRIAEGGIAELKKHVDSLIVIPNQNLFRIANEKTTFADAFVLADQVLYSGIACIVDLIVKEGLINLDLADVRTVMCGMGTSMMGTGEASGDKRAVHAAEEALANPLLDDFSLKGARGLLLSIAGSKDLTLYEVDAAASRVREEVDPDANIIVGATYDETLGDKIRVSIVASGFGREEVAEKLPPQAVRPAAPQSHVAAAPPHATLSAAAPQSVPEPAAARPRAVGSPPPLPVPKTGLPVPHPGPAPTSDFARTLSRALSDGESGVVRSPAAAPAGASATRDGRPVAPSGSDKASWSTENGVTVTRKPPQIGHQPPPADIREASGSAADSYTPAFTPAAPAQAIKTQNQVPPIEAFPPVGQRAYAAVRSEQRADSGPVDSRKSPTLPSTGKVSLLQRLSGRRVG